MRERQRERQRERVRERQRDAIPWCIRAHGGDGGRRSVPVETVAPRPGRGRCTSQGLSSVAWRPKVSAQSETSLLECRSVSTAHYLNMVNIHLIDYVRFIDILGHPDIFI